MASPGSPEQVPWPLEVPWHCHLEHNQQNESHITDDWPYPPCNSVWVTIATVQFTQLCKEGGWLHLPLSHKESLTRYRWHQEESGSMVSCKVYPLRMVCKVGYLTTQGERASRLVTRCFPGHSSGSVCKFVACFLLSCAVGMARDSENQVPAQWRPVSTPSELKTLSRSLSQLQPSISSVEWAHGCCEEVLVYKTYWAHCWA